MRFPWCALALGCMVLAGSADAVNAASLDCPVVPATKFFRSRSITVCTSPPTAGVTITRSGGGTVSGVTPSSLTTDGKGCAKFLVTCSGTAGDDVVTFSAPGFGSCQSTVSCVNGGFAAADSAPLASPFSLLTLGVLLAGMGGATIVRRRRQAGSRLR